MVRMAWKQLFELNCRIVNPNSQLWLYTIKLSMVASLIHTKNAKNFSCQLYNNQPTRRQSVMIWMIPLFLKTASFKWNVGIHSPTLPISIIRLTILPNLLFSVHGMYVFTKFDGELTFI